MKITAIAKFVANKKIGHQCHHKHTKYIALYDFFRILLIMNIELNKKEASENNSAKLRIREKWGSAVSSGGLTGFLALPEVLIRSQSRLGITSTEMMVLINILMHWWISDRKPFPGNYPIARRMGVCRRTVQRAIRSLEEKGLISTDVRISTQDDQARVTAAIDDIDVENTDALKTPYDGVRRIDLSGLVKRLQEYAVDIKGYNQRGNAIK